MARPRSAPVDQEAFQFRLTEADPLADARDGAPVAKVSPLAPADVDRLLTRLPALAEQAGDRQAFALRDRSLPPPRTGETVKTAFPPPPEPPPAAAGTGPDGKPLPLQVLRKLPEGDVDFVPFVSLTFSQPMVPVTSHDALKKLPLPVRMTPEVAGEWRWLGTQTLQFQPTRAMPMATQYTLEVPAGTRSQTGGVLAEAVKWQFATPRPEAQSASPMGKSVATDTLVLVFFTQEVNAASVLASCKLSAGSDAVPLQLATAEEIEADAPARQALQALRARKQERRMVVLKPARRLPTNTQITLTVGPDVQSLEGPRLSVRRHTFSFRTYPPLALEKAECGWRAKCLPMEAFTLRFSNMLDPKTLTAGLVQVTPAIDDMKVSVNGNHLTIRGRTLGRTKYKVQVSAELGDVFGQTLGKPVAASFETSDAASALVGIDQTFAVLDPFAKPQLPVWTVNHKALDVELRAVTALDLKDFLIWQRRRWDEDGPKAKLPGKVVWSGKIKPEGKRDSMIESALDLSPALQAGTGHVIARIVPSGMTKKQLSEDRDMELVHWLQVTQLGVSVSRDHSSVLALVTALKTGAPVAGADVRLIDPTGKVLASGKTAADGTWKTPAPTEAEGPLQLVAQQGKDTAMLPEHLSYWSDGQSSSWQAHDYDQQFSWYVVDDRHLYKPGETVSIKGWVRRIDHSPTGDVSALKGVHEVRWILRDSRGNEVKQGKTRFDGALGFDFSLELPKTINLGTTSLELSADGPEYHGSHWHQLEIQEFRTPEFETVQQVQTQTHALQGHGLVQVAAKYYAGGGLPGAPVQWSVQATQGSFQPPNHADFAFGKARPWWWWDHEELGQSSRSMQSKTDAAGQSTLRIDFDRAKEAVPWAVRVESTVTDVNRQTWSQTSALLVHPASFYVGLRQKNTLVEAGQDLLVDVVAADWDGKRLVGQQLSVQFARQDWVQEGGEWQKQEVDVASCPVQSAQEPVTCTFRPKKGGEWRLRAAAQDKDGRQTLTETIVWVSGGDVVPDRSASADTLRLVPDQASYQPGQTAKVLVIAPWKEGEALVSLDRFGRLESTRQQIRNGQLIVQVPITDAHTPGLWVSVHAVGHKPRTDAAGRPRPDAPPQPAWADGAVALQVPPLQRTLQVQLLPAAKAVAPGAKSELAVQVIDAAGKPVPDAEVLVVGVDDAVLALTGYQLPDPLGFFYPQRGQGVQHSDQRQWLQLAADGALDKLAQQLQEQADEADADKGSFGYGGAGAGGGGYGEGIGRASGGARAKTMSVESMDARPAPAPAAEARAEAAAERKSAESAKKSAKSASKDDKTPIAVRQNFTPLLLFAPSVRTDAAGKATVSLRFPDNLTRYRLMAVATARATHFGTGESSVTARLPLMARPSAPRFANFGDQFELPLVLQNQTDAPLTVDVAARATVLSLPLPGAKAGEPSRWGGQVVVPANNRVEVRLPTSARQAGTGRVQFAIATSGFADAAQIQLPVWTPATTEAFATYGVLDDGARRQPVQTPKDVAPQFGGLTVTTSSTALSALTDAVLYLVRYPYDCSEQIASRMLALAALRDVLKAFAVPGLPSDAELKSLMDKDIASLVKRQNHRGGFGLWRADGEDWPWTSLHVMQALARARQKGYDVPKDTVQRGLRYMAQIERYLPSWYGAQSRRATQALALYTRLQLGERDLRGARKLLAEWKLDDAGIEGVALLLAVFAGDGKQGADAATEVAQLRAFVQGRVVETAGNAHFVTSYGDDAYVTMASDRRADALVLDALMSADPKSDVIPKVVSGLLAHKKKGHWGSTQENAWVLLALDRYFRTYESVTPDFVAKLWLGEDFAGSHAFKGRSTERKEVDVPMAWLAQGDPRRDLIVAKEGPGRLYYRIGMTYAPSNLQLAAMDRGFVLERTYKALDKPDDVVRKPDGSWQIKAGARVKVEVRMVAPTRRYHVALVDPLPAGLEVVNPVLQGGQSAPAASDAAPMGRFWWGRWYQHENLRDERVEAFTTLLWDGVWSYDYIARATTPGRFVVPPSKAEEMYSPEVFGRSASDLVVVQ